MFMVQSANVAPVALRGRNIRKIVEKGGQYVSQYMTMGMAEFSTEIGPALPHRHDEEGIYVIEARNAFTRCGESAETLGERRPLETGMFLLYGKDEWHCFEFEGDGYLKIAFFFATPDMKRPE